MFHAVATLLAVALTGTGATAPAAPRCVEAAPPHDYMYTFNSTGDSQSSDEPTSGTVRVHGDRMRIDMDRNDSHEYILVTDNGMRMMSVHPDRREVDQINASAFEHIVGISLRAVSPIVKFKVSNDKISSQRVGSGQKLLGYATAQVRISESFDVHIVALGFNGGTEHQTVVTDYWVSPDLDLGTNPLLALLEHTATAMAQTDADFVENEASVRANALQGTPLRTIVRASSVDDKGKRHDSSRTIDITSVRVGAQPRQLFEIPSGYRIKKGSFSA